MTTGLFCFNTDEGSYLLYMLIEIEVRKATLISCGPFSICSFNI